MNEPTHLDLFSGIGGFALAAQWSGFRTIGFCEIDKYCQRVLAKNFDAHSESNGCGQGREGRSDSNGAGQFKPALFSNIFDLDGTRFRGVSLITGGFPCQPFSVAGQRRGAADDRAIWPEMFRVISEARPAWVLGENVPGIIPMELDNVLSGLAGIGYATRPFNIGAVSVDARHRRQRIWIVGRRIVPDAKCERASRRSTRNEDAEDARQRSEGEILPDSHNAGCEQGNQKDAGGSPEQSHGHRIQRRDVGNPCGAGLQGGLSTGIDDAEGREIEDGRSPSAGSLFCRWGPEEDWFTQSGMGRVANGIPSRVDRLKGLGNAIVPQVAYEILREIRKLC